MEGKIKIFKTISFLTVSYYLITSFSKQLLQKYKKIQKGFQLQQLHSLNQTICSSSDEGNIKMLM